MSKGDEMFWAPTYHYVKYKFCRVGVCKRDGKCSDCEYGPLRRYTARDYNTINKLRDDNNSLRHALKEVCDRLWYYFGQNDGKFSSNHAQNVYEVAKYYLEGGKPSES